MSEDDAIGVRWEVGSEFHWDEEAFVQAGVGLPLWLPTPHTMFTSGCGALISLVTRLHGHPRLHLPSFFCMDVAEALTSFIDLAWYRELPDGQGPHLDTLDAAPGDVVLAVNLFGRCHQEPWDVWSCEHPLVTLIEDHTHDPLSGWARASNASYCMASLRKTLPVPDGAILWSGRGEELPAAAEGENAGAWLKLSAMILKAAWLSGKDVPKSEFRSLQKTGEAALLGSATEPTVLTRAVLPLLDVWRLRSIRADNVRVLTESLLRHVDGEWSPLTYGAPGAVPFNVQLLCASETTRDSLLAHLARNQIFASVHWRQPRSGFSSGDDAAIECAARILTIPIDHRYHAADLHRVVEAVARS